MKILAAGASIALLLLAACAQMDQPDSYEYTASAVVHDGSTGTDYSVTVTYDGSRGAVDLEIIETIANNIAVVHTADIGVVDEVVEAGTGVAEHVPALDTHWDLVDHAIEIAVEPIGEFSQIDDSRWRFLELEEEFEGMVIDFCPPGH